MSDGGAGKLLRSTLICCSPLVFGSALAADLPPAPDNPAKPQPIASAVRPYDIILEVGGGVAWRPAYEGAKSNEFSPTGIATLHYLRLPGIGVVKEEGVKDYEGFSFGPSFRYVRKRDSNDYPELRGLNNIDAAFELGGRFAYTFSMLRPWIAVRYGLGGHSGIVGETGLDFMFRPNAVTEFGIGPRASFANSEYMKTYLGVTPAAALTSGLRPYQPGNGFKGAGLEFNGRYEFIPQWSVVGSFSYERFIGDAADSPIVKAGSADQYTARLGLSYKFGLKLFSE